MPVSFEAWDNLETVEAPVDYKRTKRGGVMDFAHDLFVGSAEAIDLAGGGLETMGVENPLRQWSEGMKEAELYKPDVTTYYGNDSFMKKMWSGMVQSAPASLSPLVAGAAGAAVSGPIGGGLAGVGTLVGMFGGGTYAQAIDEGTEQGLTGEALESFARKQAASEVLTETIGDIVALGAGGIFKQPVQQILKSMRSGKITPDRIVSEIAGQIGVKRTLGRLMGASSVEGGTEVINSLYQNYNRELNGLETPEEDLLLTFAIGAGLGGGISAGASVLTSSKNRARKRMIESDLASKDYDTRVGTYRAISKRLKDPELKGAWTAYAPKIYEGSVGTQDFLTEEQIAADNDAVIKQVLENPQGILNEAGVTGDTGAYEPSTPYHAKLRTSPLDVFLEEALTNDPMWVPTEERDTLKNRVAIRRQELQEEQRQAERNQGQAMPSVSQSTRDIGGARRVPVSTIGTIESNDRSQYDATLPLQQRQALAEERERTLTPAQREPIMGVSRDRGATGESATLIPEEQELTERQEFTEGRTGAITPEMKDKLSIDEVADLESRVLGVDRDEARVAEVTRRQATVSEIPVPEEAKIAEAKEDAGAPEGATEVVTMSTDEFLTLTTKSDKGKERIRSTPEPKSDYKGDEEVELSETVDLNEIDKSAPIYLHVKDGKIVGHEGRHRSALYERNGITQIPVVIVKEGTTPSSVRGQFGRGSLTVEPTSAQETKSAPKETPETTEVTEETPETTKAEDATLVNKAGKISDGTWRATYSDGTIAEQLSKSRNFRITYPDGDIGYITGKAGDILEAIRNPRKRSASIDRASERLTDTGEVRVGRSTVEETRAVSYGEAIASQETMDIVGSFVSETDLFGTPMSVKGLMKQEVEDAKMEALTNLTQRNDVTEDNVAALYAEEFNKEVSRTRDAKGEVAMGVSLQTESPEGGTLEDTISEETAVSPELAEVQKARGRSGMKWTKEAGGTKYTSGAYEINSVREGMKLMWALEGPEGPVGIFDTLEEAQEGASRARVTPAPKEETTPRRTVIRRRRSEETLTEEVPEVTEEIRPETTVGELLQRKYEGPYKALANFLLRILPEGRYDVRVVFDPEVSSSNYTDGVVTLRADVDQGVALHEVAHAITADAINSDPEIAAEIRALMDQTKAYLVENNLMTREDLDLIESRSTSKGFKSLLEVQGEVSAQLGTEAFGGLEAIAYGLTNEREFLAQIFNSRDMRELLSQIPSEKPKVSLWDKIVSALLSALGISKMKRSALNDALELTASIAKMEIGESYGATGITDEALESAPPIKRPKDYKQEAEASMEKEEVTFPNKIKDIGEQFGDSVSKWAKFAFKPISDEVNRLDSKIGARLSRMDSDSMLNHKRYQNMVEPFIKEFKGLSEVEKRQVSMALFNSNYREAEKLITKNSLDSMKEVLKELDTRARKVGMQYGASKENYFPRSIKDLNAYLDFMKNTGENGYFSETFRQLERTKDSVSDHDKTEAIARVLQSGNITAIPRPGSTKERTVPFVNRDNYKFYNNADDSLIAHIFDMNEKIGFREFAGGNIRRKKMNEAASVAKKLSDPTLSKSRREALESELREIEDYITNEERILDDSVAELVKEAGRTLTSEDGKALVDILKVRLRPKGPHGFIDHVRNLGYATTMGNFMSALTQIADTPVALFVSRDKSQGIRGLWSTGAALKESLTNVAKVISSDINAKTGLLKSYDMSESFVAQMDFTNTLREFSRGNYTSGLVDTLFKYSGLKYTDLIGKEALMQSSFNNLQNMDKETFIQKYGDLVADPELAYSERTEKMADSTKAIVFSELSKWQPVSMSQQSQAYVGSGNWRIAFMLKTFQLRATNAAIREGMQKYEASDRGPVAKAEMAATIGSIVMVYAIAGASVDELKDLIRGKDRDFSDTVMDNVFSMFLISTFDAEMGLERDQLITKIIEGNMPPLRWLDQIGGDLYSIFDEDKEQKFKTLNLIPFVGNLVYGYSPAGRSTEFKIRRDELREDLKDAVANGESLTGFSSRVHEYNEWASENDEPTVNLFQMLQRIR